MRNFSELSSAEQTEELRREYTRPSYFQNKLGADAVEIDCAAHSRILREAVTKLLLKNGMIQAPVDLENIHQVVPKSVSDYVVDGNVNGLAIACYEADDELLTAMQNFVREVLQERVIGEPVYFQRTPTVRFHCPNAGNSHVYPHYHSDVCLRHPPFEVNVWLPLTEHLGDHGFALANVEETAKLLAACDYDMDKFNVELRDNPRVIRKCEEICRRQTTPFGKVLLFDTRALHTSIPMRTHTRVSIDIRIVPISEWSKARYIYQGTGRRQVLFAPGGCYDSQHSGQLKESTVAG